MQISLKMLSTVSLTGFQLSAFSGQRSAKDKKKFSTSCLSPCMGTKSVIAKQSFAVKLGFQAELGNQRHNYEMKITQFILLLLNADS
jgi:hypothetical protein